MRVRALAAALLLGAVAVACSGSGGPGSGGAYVALGDSLSEGSGASDPAAAFVPLIHQALGDGFELINHGHAGDTSAEMFDHGHFDDAIEEIERRSLDGDDGNDVRLITLEIGGNDLLDLYFDLVLGGTCPNVKTSLERDAECIQPLTNALDGYRPRLRQALDGLHEAAPSATIVLLTLYNPFSGRIPIFTELGDFSLEGEEGTPVDEGLNDIIRQEADGRDVLLVDLYPLFQDKAQTLVSDDLIHPNDAGHALIAGVIIEALADAGFPLAGAE